VEQNEDFGVGLLGEHPFDRPLDMMADAAGEDRDPEAHLTILHSDPALRAPRAAG
jgi:hypothetical protein